MSRGFYVVMYLIMFLASGIELFLHIYYDENIDDIRLNKIFDTLWFTLVTIIYIIVIVFLIKQLNKINEKELRQEKISIIRQFVIFLGGYIIGVIYTFIEYFNPTQYSYFVDQVSLSVSVILWDAIPVTYMLFVHHHTFRSMIRQMHHDSVDSKDGRAPGEIGYLRIASVNVDSGHSATEPSE